jgi:hypothetical protein
LTGCKLVGFSRRVVLLSKYVKKPKHISQPVPCQLFITPETLSDMAVKVSTPHAV